MAAATERVHATCIALDGRGVLIRGPSGSGKSDLALRCLAQGPNSISSYALLLVADDQVMLERVNDSVIATAPAVLRGKLEVRGQGIVELNVAEQAEIVLIADLVPSEQNLDRLPDPILTTSLCGCLIPVLRMHPFEASAPAKLLVALTSGYGR